MIKKELEKKPLLVVYKESEEDITLELSKDITFIEKLALQTFLRVYVKDLEDDLREYNLSFGEEEE